jgi:hypothetical protein
MTTSNQTGKDESKTNLSHLTLRKLIGWLGLLLPFLVWLLAWSYEPSISDYYYTRSGVLFIAVCSLMGAFLISYRGYEKKENEAFSDNLVTWVGGIFILLVVAVPTPLDCDGCPCPTPICHQDKWLGIIHFASAALFFVVMGYMSAFHFVRGDNFNDAKKRRNVVYRIAGFGMWAILVATGLLLWLTDIKSSFAHFIFWVEVALLILFGASWLVKSKALQKVGL